jgi:hypothetical protein
MPSRNRRSPPRARFQPHVRERLAAGGERSVEFAVAARRIFPLLLDQVGELATRKSIAFSLSLAEQPPRRDKQRKRLLARRLLGRVGDIRDDRPARDHGRPMFDACRRDIGGVDVHGYRTESLAGAAGIQRAKHNKRRSPGENDGAP